MTDTHSAPERIWATGNGKSGSWNDSKGRMKSVMPDGWQTEYILADLVGELLAAMEAADDEAIRAQTPGAGDWSPEPVSRMLTVRNKLADLIPPEAGE